MVDCGLGEVRAKSRAVATLSAKTLNSGLIEVSMRPVDVLFVGPKLIHFRRRRGL
jgi:hypothetical protein